MATTNPSPYGPLKGEVLLANGSRVLFEATRWEFSYPVDGSNGCCTIKAEERPNQQYGIYMDGKQLTQKIREMQNQSIKINVELTEEGKRAFKETVLGKVESVHSKPPVGSWDERVKTQHQLLEEMYKVLLEYVETFPREHELRDKAYPLINCVYENLKEWGDNILASEKETPPKKANERDPLWEIVTELSESNGTTPGSVYQRCIFCNAKDDSLSNLKHEDTCIISRAYNLVWHKQYKESAKKQEESTALFDVVSKCMHNFPNACNVMAQSNEDKMFVTYHADTHTWDLAVWRPQRQNIPIGKTKLKAELQEMARKYNIDLSKGWRVINHQYKY